MFYKYFIWPCQTTSFKSCSVKLHCFNIAAFWVDTPFYLLRQILVMKFILVTKPQHVLLSNGTTPGEDQMFCCDWEKKTQPRNIQTYHTYGCLLPWGEETCVSWHVGSDKFGSDFTCFNALALLLKSQFGVLFGTKAVFMLKVTLSHAPVLLSSGESVDLSVNNFV